MKNIAFICNHNSCRSQIAEYFGRKYLSDIYNIYSAGSEIKSEINKDAVRIINELYSDDISLTQHPKTINEIPKPDIILCLGGDPEKIYNRKPETSLEEVTRQTSALKDFCNNLLSFYFYLPSK